MSAGILSQISFKKETTWGTAVVPDKTMAVHYTSGISTDNDLQMLHGTKAILAANYGSFVGQRMHEGEFEFDLFPDYAGYFLLGAFGNVSSVAKIAPNASVFDHTFTEIEAKPSFTIEQAIGENVRRFAGSLITGFNIEANTGEPVVMTALVAAKSQASATKISPALTTVDPFNWTQAVVKIGGATMSNVVSLSMEYRNGIEMVHTLNNTNDPSLNGISGGSEVSGSIEFYLDSTALTELNNYLANSNRSIALELTGPTIGTSANYKLVVTVPKAAFTSGVTELTDDYNRLTLDYSGIYDTSTSKLLDAVLTNLLTAYS